MITSVSRAATTCSFFFGRSERARNVSGLFDPGGAARTYVDRTELLGPVRSGDGEHLLKGATGDRDLHVALSVHLRHEADAHAHLDDIVGAPKKIHATR